MKHTINGFVTMNIPRWEGEKQRIDFYTFDPRKFAGNENIAVVREQAIEIEVADDYDPRAAYIDALKAQKNAIRAAFAKQVKDLDDRIANLQAITYVSEGSRAD